MKKLTLTYIPEYVSHIISINLYLYIANNKKTYFPFVFEFVTVDI